MKRSLHMRALLATSMSSSHNFSCYTSLSLSLSLCVCVCLSVSAARFMSTPAHFLAATLTSDHAPISFAHARGRPCGGV